MSEDDEVSKFLKKMGMGDQQPQGSQWDKIILRNSSYLIVGDVGTGKSALAHWLLETFSQKYDLQPVIVGFPGEKRDLLPEHFIVVDDPDELTKMEYTICFIDEADLQLPIEDTKARKHVINFLSLPRHRKQIFLLAFHFPRLVMGRYLPFFSAFLLKRPPYLIELASKRRNDTMSEMMKRAEERFNELVPPNWQPTEEQLHPVEVIRSTYVVAPRIRWQGMLQNPVSSFWTQELSEIWAAAEIEPEKPKVKDLFDELRVTPEMRRRAVKIEDIHGKSCFIDPFTNKKWVE